MVILMLNISDIYYLQVTIQRQECPKQDSQWCAESNCTSHQATFNSLQVS